MALGLSLEGGNVPAKARLLADAIPDAIKTLSGYIVLSATVDRSSQASCAFSTSKGFFVSLVLQ